MVQDDERVGLDGVRVVFDDDRVVSDAGIALVATLADRLGIEGLVGRFVMLRRDIPGAANERQAAGRPVMWSMTRRNSSVGEKSTYSESSSASGAWPGAQ